MTTYAGTKAVYEIRSGATAGNLGGGAFNPQNANFLADGAATVATGNSPVFTSTSYNFVAGDVGAWLYIKSGTNWTPGWYQIASVASNAATLSASIGQGVQISNNRFITQTVAGIATTASPTSGTWGIDYSQQNAAQFTNNVLTGTTTTCTDATNPFGVQMVGNFICISTGTGVTAGWYEIVSVSGVTATLDRTAGATYSACTYYLGGAVSLGGVTAGITDAVFLALGSGAATSGSRFFIKKGTYTFGQTINPSVSGNSSWPVIIEGYNSIRGDRPSIASGNQPNITNSVLFRSGDYIQFWCLTFTSTNGSYALGMGSGSGGVMAINCKAVNKSTGNGLNATTTNCVCIGCEGVAYRASAFSSQNTGCAFIGCYAHDSATGIETNSAGNNILINNIVTGCYSGDIDLAGQFNIVYGNTVYGAENKLSIGVNIPENTSVFMNNILYGLVSGYGGADTQYIGVSDYNCFFNNTNNIAAATTGTFIGSNDLTATNPSFTSMTQRTGVTATTTAGNHLVQSGATFTTWGITAGVDCVYISAGTGVTVGYYGILSVDSQTQITVDVTLSANATADKVWSITQGHNLLPTATLAGSPGAFPAGLTTGHLEIGAVQPATGGSSVSSFTFGS